MILLNLVLFVMLMEMALGVLHEGDVRKIHRIAGLRSGRVRGYQNRINLNRQGKTSAAPTGIHAKGGKGGKMATRAFAGTDAAGKGPNPDQNAAKSGRPPSGKSDKSKNNNNNGGGDFANLGAGGAATLSVMAADGGYTGDGGRLIIPLDERYLELTVQLEAAQIAFAGLSLMTEVLRKRLFHKDLTGQISLDQAMFKRQTIVNRQAVMDRVMVTTPMQPQDRMGKKPKKPTAPPAGNNAAKSSSGKSSAFDRFPPDPMKSRTKALVALMSLPGIFYNMQNRGPWAIIRAKKAGGKSGKGGRIDLNKDEEISIGKFGEMDEEGQLLDSELDLFTTESPKKKGKAAKLPKVGGKGGKSAKLGKNGELGKARLVNDQGDPILGGGAKSGKGSLGVNSAKGPKIGKTNTMGANSNNNVAAAKNANNQVDNAMMDDLHIELPNKQQGSG